MTRQQVQQLAGRYQFPAVLVEETGRAGEFLGYVRVIDLGLESGDLAASLRPLPVIPATMTYLSAMVRMQSTSDSLVRVADPEGKTVGILTSQSVREPLFRGTR